MPLNNHILHQRRRAGILLHPTSLPGPLPRGMICHDAYRFIEFLSQSGMSVWQMLPMAPTHSDLSPYQCLSAHACDSSLISLDWLKDHGLLDEVDHVQDYQQHEQSLRLAWQTLQRQKVHLLHKKLSAFIETHAEWLPDYALFMAIREQQHGQLWTQWPKQLRDREQAALNRARKDLAEEIDFHYFTQLIFFEQWHDLRAYAQQHNVLLFGDLPIYVSHDSADVWANRELFLLDKKGEPEIVAGVPPDYFSETGQRWGNPQYNWPAMQAQDFTWWQERLNTQLHLFDVIRVDHFRGFQAYWEIRAEQETAIDGKWIEAPGEALLTTLQKNLHQLPLVAEDLGVITEQVTALREQFELPGMKILQFAFDGDPANAYLPHNHEFNSVVYTGTHDNDTTVSWFEQLNEPEQKLIYDYLGAQQDEAMPWPLIRACLASVSCLAMLPMQDVLALGKGHRMNTPGTTEGNWQWRFEWQQLPQHLAENLKTMCQRFDR
jgi:4-alpha-glucanotransferase